jgi:hypothetical protein
MTEDSEGLAFKSRDALLREQSHESDTERMDIRSVAHLLGVSTFAAPCVAGFANAGARADRVKALHFKAHAGLLLQ